MNRELHGASKSMKKKKVARDEGLGNVKNTAEGESLCLGIRSSAEVRATKAHKESKDWRKWR